MASCPKHWWYICLPASWFRGHARSAEMDSLSEWGANCLMNQQQERAQQNWQPVPTSHMWAAAHVLTWGTLEQELLGFILCLFSCSLQLCKSSSKYTDAEDWSFAFVCGINLFSRLFLVSQEMNSFHRNRFAKENTMRAFRLPVSLHITIPWDSLITSATDPWGFVPEGC